MRKRICMLECAREPFLCGLNVDVEVGDGKAFCNII